MARIPGLTVDGEPAVYHVISQTALDGFVLGDVEKEYLLVRMQPEAAFSEDDIRVRFQRSYGADSERQLTDGQIPTLRAKWVSLSEYVKELKQSFSRWYNKRHGRKRASSGVSALRACWWTMAIP